MRYTGTKWLADKVSSTFTSPLIAVVGLPNGEVVAAGDGATFWHYVGGKWTAKPKPGKLTTRVTGLWALDAKNVYATATDPSTDGSLWKYGGGSWSDVTPSFTGGLGRVAKVWGSSKTNIFMVGAGGVRYQKGSGGWVQHNKALWWTLHSIWGDGSKYKYAAGGENGFGYLLRHDGTSWTTFTPTGLGTVPTLRGVTSVGGKVYAVGHNGKVFIHSGSSWSSGSPLNSKDLRAVWAADPKHVFAVGNDGKALRHDGSSWYEIKTATSLNLHGVWGTTATNVFAVGAQGTILRYAGTSAGFVTMKSPVTRDLMSVWGTSGKNIYAVGGYGTILHYSSGSWTTVTVPAANRDLHAVFGTGSKDIYVTGTRGTLLRYNGSLWNSEASGTFSSLLGVWAHATAGRAPRLLLTVPATFDLGRFNAYGSNWTSRTRTDTLNNEKHYQYAFFRPKAGATLLPRGHHHQRYAVIPGRLAGSGVGALSPADKQAHEQ